MGDLKQTLGEHDVSDLIGLRVVVANTAHQIIEADGEVSVEIPEIEALAVAAAIARCLMPVRLKGPELRSIRKIAGWTATDLAGKMGEKTSHETISRWENEKQPMGGYAEKVFRLVACEEMKEQAPGVDYTAESIAKLTIIDPYRVDPNYEMPALQFERVKMRSQSKKLVEAWELEQPLLAA